MSALYPYPAVQYIPLSFGVIFRRDNLPLHPFILIGPEISIQKEAFEEKIGLQLPDLKETADQLFLLAGGFEPLEIKYRGYYVTIKAALNPTLLLISLPKHYFYKDTLVFQAKKEDGSLLVAKTYQLRKNAGNPCRPTRL
ncbi:MAG: hypothetical protein GX081_08190 [Firmicutes bacterium]|nr:hypothetical protein [Bacillota bacterium]